MQQPLILVIDDSPEDRRFARVTLEASSFRVSEAANGRLGLEAAARLNPACIVLDHGLPDMEGLEVLRSLGPSGGKPAPPVVMLTGTSDPRVGAAAIKSGAQDFLVKDRMEHSLAQSVRHALDRCSLMRDRERAANENARLASLVRASPHALLAVATDGTLQSWNPAAERLYGCQPSEMLGRPVRTLWPPEQAAQHETLFALATEGRSTALESEHLRSDSSRVEVLVSAAPLRNAEQEVVGFVVTAEDVSLRKQAERSLLLSEQRLRLATEAGRIGTFDWDIRSGQVVWSDAMSRNAGFAPGGFGGSIEAFRALVHPEDLPKVEQGLAKALNGEDLYEAEFRMVKPDGTTRTALARGLFIRDANGAPERLIGIDLDVTETKVMEKKQKLLLQELGHRIKNTLAVVLSIIGQTGRAANIPREILTSLNGRIQSLGRAHDLLISGADDADLHALAHSQLAPFEGETGSGRVELSGPSVAIARELALTVGLVLHELGTNAQKHGALSNEHGRIHLRWQVEGQVLQLHWSERGGPTPVPSFRRGFGSMLLEKGLPNARVMRDFRAEGLVCEIAIPLA